jgi:acetylserotonin N-methyltransferase
MHAHLIENDKLMWDLWLGRYHLSAVAAADTLDIFQCIEQGAGSTGRLAKQLDLDARGIEALCCLLASLGFIEKQHEGIALSPSSKNYLLKDSLSYWGPALGRARESQEYQRIVDTFLKAQAAKLQENDKELSSMWEQGRIDKKAAEQFTSIMNCSIYSSALSAVQSGAFDKIQHLLDVGGGSGCYASLFAKHCPKSKATIYELPEVCEVAEQYLMQFNSSGQVFCYLGNFFKDPFPSNVDGILFSNILHDWKPEQGLTLLKKAHEALPTGGKVFIHEMLLNEEKNGPLVPAGFNLLMYINHGSQQFSQTELYAMLGQAGFKHEQTIKPHPYYWLLIAEK